MTSSTVASSTHTHNTHIRWELTQPTKDENDADSHCSICLDSTVQSPILGHQPLSGGKVVCRVHEVCLRTARVVNPRLSFTCPTCRGPYDPAEIPPIPMSFAERTIEMLSEGKRLSKRIAINFSTYAIGGVFFLSGPMIGNLAAGNFSFVLGFGAGGILGSCMSATALSLVGDVSLYAGRRVIEWTHVQNPKLRKVLFVCTVAIAAIASIYAATLLYSALQACIISRLAPETQAVYSYLMGTASRPGTVSKAMWDAASQAKDRLVGIGFGSMGAFLTAFLVKHALFTSETHLDDTILLAR